ncbi:MAG TPA: lipopolysaccharide transport periplasmic protein LptA [Xanthomonadaceae bacterium]|nr:lipopolysaccharide transport periplasmic protein LptA [Xanthomonadaceae bacterium]
MSPFVERMTTLPVVAAAFVLALGLAAASDAGARSSDRNQPMDLVSDRSSCGVDGTGACEFSGNVQISQGTLRISAAQATLHRVDGDISRVVLTGSPVILRQEMDDGTPMTARAAQVDYDLRSEVVVFTGGVNIEQPRGTLSGERVVYNLQTGQVEGGGEGAGRVRMRILPRGGTEPAGEPATEPAAGAQDDTQGEG